MPYSVVSGSANTADGALAAHLICNGVNCHMCHSMVNPEFKSGLELALIQISRFWLRLGFCLNLLAMLSLFFNPDGIRRGPFKDSESEHKFHYSPFHSSSQFCGTCHEIGNPAVTKQSDGSYTYNTINRA